MTGFAWLMNEANDDTRMATFGSERSPQPTSITSAPQLVTPICTGPLGVCTITGPPLSPAQAIANGGAWCAESAVQIIAASTACGYAFWQSPAPNTLSAACCSGARDGGPASVTGPVMP